MTDTPHLLQALLAALADFQAALARENIALQGNPGDLGEAVRDKEQRIGELSRLWLELAKQLGCPAPASRALIEARLQAKPDGKLALSWAKVIAQADASEQLNQLNGKLIQEQMRRTENALRILQSSASQRTLYGADGQVVDLFQAGRRIDEA